jgi:Cutinase
MRRFLIDAKRVPLLAAALAVAGALSGGTAAYATTTPTAADASSAPCSFNPASSCQSTDSTVALDTHYSGASACTFTWHIEWGDGSVSDVTDTDPADGYVLLAHHTYAKAAAYTISSTGQVVAGDCTTTPGTYHFSFIKPTWTPPVLQPCSASFIGVPGSGQAAANSSVEMATVQAWVTVDAGKAGQKLRNSAILSYPAVQWYKYVEPSLRLNWNNLGKSEATGEKDLLAKINADRAAAAKAGCAKAPILLAGYSQGAEVVIRAVDALSPSVRNTVSVALLGNPSFTPGAAGDLDLNTSPGLRGIRPSFLLGQKYTLSSDVLKRTIDICAASDPICAYHVSELPALATGTSAHYEYVILTHDGITLTDYAANSLWEHRG